MPPKPVPSHRLVHTQRYRALRERVLREEPTCRLRLPGCTIVSDSLDHVIPRSLRPDLTLVRSNCRGSCRNCNSTRGNRIVLQRDTPPPPPPQVVAFFHPSQRAPQSNSQSKF
jgi:5-methylcytosine-specific restriction endonuclease McrA